MQEKKYKEAASFYEPIVHKNFDSGVGSQLECFGTTRDLLQILNTSAMILANLVVCYIMTNQNEDAEELLRKVEREETAALEERPNEKHFHNSIISLVIGSLYCSKVDNVLEYFL